MTPINTDGAIELDEGQAVDAFLRKMTDAPEPSKSVEEDSKTEKEEAAPADEEAEDAEETPADEGSDEGQEDDAEDEGQGDDDVKKKYVDDEGLYHKIKIGDETHEVPVKDLARLYGQEAALTKRSQEVAERRKALDTEAATLLARNQAMVERASQRWAQYKDLDWLTLSRNPHLSNEEITALRNEAQSAYEDLAFLTSEASQYMGAIQQRQEMEIREIAKNTIKELSDPEKGLPGWGEKLYDDIRAHALSVGAPPETVNRLVDPWAIRLIHDAMMFQKGKSKVVTEKVSKVNKAPRRVVKTTTNASESKSNASRMAPSKQAMDRLRVSGSTDAAADAFLVRLAGGGSDD
jgi:hypothetical protein